MKALDFNLPHEINYDFDTGITSFRDSRLVLLNANSLGLLRQNIIDVLGKDKAREFFLKFGYQNGYSDFLQMKVNYEFENEMELLASGPVIHTWEGIVKATSKTIEFDRAKGHFLFTGVWTNSYEAEQFLTFNPEDNEPVCWTLMGYASGWCSGFFKSPVLAIEPKCMGMGDEHCEWKIMPPDEWGDEKWPYVTALKEFWAMLRS